MFILSAICYILFTFVIKQRGSVLRLNSQGSWWVLIGWLLYLEYSLAADWPVAVVPWNTSLLVLATKYMMWDDIYFFSDLT